MAKTLVKLKDGHEGSAVNGTGGCHARLPKTHEDARDGVGPCNAAWAVDWLNRMGPDDQPNPYVNGAMTNGEVRAKKLVEWGDHIKKDRIEE